MVPGTACAGYPYFPMARMGRISNSMHVCLCSTLPLIAPCIVIASTSISLAGKWAWTLLLSQPLFKGHVQATYTQPTSYSPASSFYGSREQRVRMRGGSLPRQQHFVPVTWLRAMLSHLSPPLISFPPLWPLPPPLIATLLFSQYKRPTIGKISIFRPSWLISFPDAETCHPCFPATHTLTA